eukprot:876493-Rhodomonas_salina.1
MSPETTSTALSEHISVYSIAIVGSRNSGRTEVSKHIHTALPAMSGGQVRTIYVPSVSQIVRSQLDSHDQLSYDSQIANGMTDQLRLTSFTIRRTFKQGVMNLVRQMIRQSSTTVKAVVIIYYEGDLDRSAHLGLEGALHEAQHV